VAVSDPSSDLITLLRSLNPDFLFDGIAENNDEEIGIVLNWLKVCSITLPANIVVI
jgi:hypothetical protein